MQNLIAPYNLTRKQLIAEMRESISVCVGAAIATLDDTSTVVGFPVDMLRASPNGIPRFLEAIPNAITPQISSFVLFARGRLLEDYGVGVLSFIENELIQIAPDVIEKMERESSFYGHAYSAEGGPWPSDRYTLITLYLFIETAKLAHFTVSALD